MFSVRIPRRIRFQATVVAVGAVTAGLICAWYFLTGSGVWNKNPKATQVILYFSQVFSGNWSPDHREELPEYLFTVGTFIAILLNLTTVVAIIGAAINTFFVQRLRIMDIETAFKLEKDTILVSIINRLPKAQADILTPLIVDGFKEGHEVWEREVLPEFLGRSGAEEFLKSVKRSHTSSRENVPR